jgi:hypothetical protein
MHESTPLKSIATAVLTLTAIILVAVACKYSSLPGAKMNMFEGTNAQDGAAKIKTRLGVENVKISRIEIHDDRMSIVVQDPKKPKNFDEYSYERGAVAGPTPVPAMTFGNKELTADKSRLFDLNDVNLSLVPDVCRKAVEKSQIEEGKCENISVDWESPRWTRSKEENDKAWDERSKKIMSGKIDPLKVVGDDFENLVVTWRVWIRGPRATKDFWVDSKGTVWDYH